MAVTPTKQRVPIDMALLQILNQRIENRADDPIVLVEGHIWLNTTTHKTKRVENGVIVPFFSAADAAKLAEFEAAIDAAQAAAEAAQAEIDAITSDNILSKYEKSVIKAQYDLLTAEQTGIDAVAILYEITTEKTNYDNALTALTAYLLSLNPLYTDYTQDTVIDGALFRQLFADVYTTRQKLTNAMSVYAHNVLDQALGLAQDAKTAADQAVIDAANAISIIEGVANDGILAIQEKPAIVQQYNVLTAEKTGIDAKATSFGVTTEKTAYDNAVTALTAYITGLTPAYNDYTQNTVIVRVDFNNAFELVYSTRQTLLNAIYEAAKLLADDAAIIARSKGKHFITTPTTPYYVGDTWSNTIDLYRCIIQRLTGSFNAADWEVATHYDRTQVTIDNGIITAGRIEVGGGELGEGNAGMNGSVSGSPTLDIRFWAGADYAHRTTAPWRVQDDGTFYATQGFIGAWHVDSDSIHSGTKVTGNGFAAAPGDVTFKSDGSIHAYKFFINADGTVSFKSTGSEISTTPMGPGDLDGAVSTINANGASSPDVYELELVYGSGGYCRIDIDGHYHDATWSGGSLHATMLLFVATASYSGIVVSNPSGEIIRFTKAGGAIGYISCSNVGIQAVPPYGSKTSAYGAPNAQIDKVVLSGAEGMCSVNCNGFTGVVHYSSSTLSGDPLTNSAADFVVNNAVDALTHDVILTSSGNEIYLESNNPGTAFSPATESNNIPAYVLGGITMIGNEIFEPASNTNQGAIGINMRGYNGGTSKARYLYIGDGRGNVIIKVDGYTGNIVMTIPDAANPGIPHTGYLYYDAGTLKIS